jgi:transcriptional regulator with XRE-family HTH domain
MANNQIRGLRLARRLTQAKLAELVGDAVSRATGRASAIDAQTISRIERGEITWPSSDTRKALRAVFGVNSDDDLGLYPKRTRLDAEKHEATHTLLDPLRIAHEWLVADSPQVIESRFGRRIGSALAEQLQSRVVDLRHLDDQISGKDLVPVVTKELRDSMRLVRDASYSSAVGKSLLTSVGELAQLAGWVASDAGKHRQAESFYLSGVNAATDAGEYGLAGNLLSSLSYQMTNLSRSADALLLARTAAKGAVGAPPIVRALLLERVAWAAARVGDAETAARVLDQVDDLFEARSSGDEEPEWVYWVSRDEVDTMRARCAVELGNPNAAERLLIPVLSRYPKESERESALYWSWLAEAYIRAGQLDQAQPAIETVRGFAESVRSQRVEDRVTILDSLTSAPQGRG